MWLRALVERLKVSTQGIGRSVDYTRQTAYRRPPALYRHIQWLSVWLTSLGLVPETVVVLEVRGRRSGKPRRNVVVRTPYQGDYYVVALAGESEWVRNVRAAAGEVVIRHGSARQVHLVEVPVDERPPIIRAYLHRPGWSSPSQESRHYFGLRQDSSVEEIRSIVDRYPVFRVIEAAAESLGHASQVLDAQRAVTSRRGERELMTARGYDVVQLSPTRMLTIDLLHGFSRKPMIHGLIEADVTLPRRRLREIGERPGETLSFTAFLIHCLARAVSEDGTLNVARSGRRLYRFDAVNVGTMVEREQRGEKTVAPLRIDSADRKTVWQIHDEIRHAQTMPIQNVGSVQGFEWIMRIPSPVRRLMWRLIHGRPRLAHRYGLLVGLAAVGMFGDGAGWGLPFTPATVQLTVGGIGKRPAINNGELIEREFLSLTISFDHEIIDGAPAARFSARLRQLIEGADGLAADGAIVSSSLDPDERSAALGREVELAPRP